MQSKNISKESFNIRIKEFVLRLIRFLECLPDNSTYRVIKAQLLRSGSSIGANYFESRAASSKNDFTNFFNHSLKSANETMFWIEILIDLDQAKSEQAKLLLQEANEIANIFASSILTLKGKRTIHF
ncbi:MAG: four helix bundle protein [Candidatus Omnitrophota bacterium]